MNQRTQDRDIKEFARCAERKLDLQKPGNGDGNQYRRRQVPGVRYILHITYNPERQEMDLERFEDYQNSKKARDDVNKIAGNVGYGGQDDDRI